MMPPLNCLRFSRTLGTMNGWRAAAGLAAIVVGAASCQGQDPCPMNGTPCGGDPSGSWTVVNWCREASYDPPQPLTYYGQPDTMARQPPPEATSSDWCSYLVYDANMGIKSFLFPHDALLPSGGSVTYDANGTFGAKLSTTGTGHVDLSASCLTRFGDRFGALDTRCANLASDLTTLAATELSYQNIGCYDDQDGGCKCTYDIAFEPSGGSMSGRWGTDGTLLTHFSGAMQLPSQADFCVDGSGILTLWGHDQTDIWDQSGLRTLSLQRLP
jgi:hypothetical protein